MSFNVNVQRDLPSGLSAMILVFFMLDIIVNLNTAIYEQGKLTFNHKNIMMKYLRSSFLLDGLSILYFFDFGGNYHEYLGTLFFLRIKTLRKIIRKIQGFVFMDETTYYLIYLIKLILTVIFISHIFSCLWHYVATVSSTSNKDNWIDYLNLTKADWKARYLNSFYFVVVVMNTVGFGDIVPRNNWEKIFAIFFIYFACYIFAFSLNIIGIIIQTLNKKSSSFNSALLTLNVYMFQKHIPLDLRVRIRKYLEFLFHEEQLQTVEQAHAIINKLSPSLQEELLLSANGLPLRNIGIFSSLSETSLRQLTLSLREVTLTPGDLLFAPSQPFPSLYIILSGEIELFLPIGGTEKSFCKMGKGGVLREKGFITGFGGEEGGRSLGFSKVMEVEREKFLEIIKNNARDFEKFCLAKESTIFSTKMVLNGQRCEGCGEEGHLVWECRWVCLNVRKQGVIARHCWDSGQKRMEFGRKRNKMNSLKLKKKCREAMKDLMGELFSDEEEEEQDHGQEEEEKDEVSFEENFNFTKKLEKLNSVGNPREYGILLNQRSFSNDRLSPSERVKLKGKSMIISQMNRQSSGTLHTKSNKSSKSIIKVDGAAKVSNLLFKEKIGASSHSISDRMIMSIGPISSRTNSFKENQSDVIHEDNNAITFGNDLDINDQSILVKDSIEFERLIFETAKNYDYFFPHNNLEVLLQKFDLELQKKLKRRKTFKRVESNFTIIEKKIMEITLEREREKRKNRSDQNLSAEKDIVGKENNQKKGILTKEKVILILKEIEKRKRKNKSRFYRIKDWVKNKLSLAKFIMKK